MDARTASWLISVGVDFEFGKYVRRKSDARYHENIRQQARIGRTNITSPPVPQCANTPIG
jgi:hypothetical protein